MILLSVIYYFLSYLRL